MLLLPSHPSGPPRYQRSHHPTAPLRCCCYCGDGSFFAMGQLDHELDAPLGYSLGSCVCVTQDMRCQQRWRKLGKFERTFGRIHFFVFAHTLTAVILYAREPVRLLRFSCVARFFLALQMEEGRMIKLDKTGQSKDKLQTRCQARHVGHWYERTY